MTSYKIHILDAPFLETTSINLCDLIMVFVFQFSQSIQTMMYYVRINVRKMERITIGVIKFLGREVIAHQVCIANVALSLSKNSPRNLKIYSSPGFKNLSCPIVRWKVLLFMATSFFSV